MDNNEHGTNLAEVGTDCISRQAAIRAIEDEWDGCCSEYPATQIIYDTTEAIERLPIIQPEITHEQAVAYLQSTGWMQEHDRQMMIDGAHRLTAQPTIQPKKGTWIDIRENTEWYAREYECSECGGTMLGESNFCPNCGAKMEVTT